MKKNKIIWFIVGILLLGLIIFIVTKKEKPLKPLDIPITNVVMNKTTKDYLTPMINAGLYELKIDSVFVIVKPMSITIKNNGLGDGGFELMGTIIGNRNQYMLYIGDLNRSESFTIVSHELIHLEQFHSGRLVKKDSTNLVLWEGKIYDVKQIPYLERPWEIEAFNKDKVLEKKIIKRLLD